MFVASFLDIELKKNISIDLTLIRHAFSLPRYDQIRSVEAMSEMSLSNIQRKRNM